jgi:hypothetical protein
MTHARAISRKATGLINIVIISRLMIVGMVISLAIAVLR